MIGKWIIFLLSLWILEVNGFDVPLEVWGISITISIIALLLAVMQVIGEERGKY